MTDSFGTPTGDQGGEEGKNFGQNTDGGQTGTDGSQGIDPAAYEALRKRDESAQAHIERLERENKEARDKVVELENNLSNATKLDDALARIATQGEGQAQSGIDRADVAQVVKEVLGQEQTLSQQETNWSNVLGTLTKEYGDWETANAKVQERARELDISDTDATNMARTNPKAFMQLFAPQGQSATTQKAGSSTGAGEMGQRGAHQEVAGEVRDKAWYNNLRRTNPNLYWSVETQAQLRRDLFTD